MLLRLFYTTSQRLIKNLSFYFLPLLSGFLIGSSYIPFPPWALFFCYVPLWLFSLKQQNLKFILIGAWLCQFILTLIGFSWLAVSIREMWLAPWPLAILGLLLFSSFANLHIPIALLFWFISRKLLRPRKNPIVNSVLIPFLFPVYSALSIEYYPMIFEWHLGYTWLYARWPAFQTAEIWGFQFLNTLTLFFNLLFLFIFQNLKKTTQTNAVLSPLKNKSIIKQWLSSSSQKIKNKNIFIPLIFWIVFFTGLNFYGQYLKHHWPDPDQKISVLIVQPNIENHKQGDEQWDEWILSKVLQETTKHLWTHSSKEKNREIHKKQRKNYIKNNSQEQTHLAKAEPLIKSHSDSHLDFILWPEGSYPYIISKAKAQNRTDPVQKWASVFNTPLVVSAEGESSQKHTNSIFIFDQNGQLMQAPYDKTVLMPFGEYIPLEKWFPFLKWIFLKDGTFTPGIGANKVIGLNELNLGLQICYESLFDWFTRRMTYEGADILVNVTNDAWFGSWQEPRQHLYMTAARAIEVRRPLIRGTNSGFSAVISAKGNFHSPWVQNKSLSWIEKVPYSKKNKKQSLFVSWGYYINQLFLGIVLILIHILPKAVFRSS